MTSSGREISIHAYNLIIGLVLCWGFLANWWMIENIPTEAILRVPRLLFFVFYFISAFFGIFLFTKSSSALVSFIGYNFVVLPFGFVLNLVLSRYSPDIVIEAVQITGAVTVVMMLMGTFFPNFFSEIFGALSVALIALIITEWVAYFFFNADRSIFDWIAVAIFCGYIGYDWGRSNQIPKTVDNAVDSAAALYMDIISLFIRILRILGRRR